MRSFFSTLPRNIIRVFEGRNLLWHFAAIILTITCVTSGLDWRYFNATRGDLIWTVAFPAVVIGGLLPFILPLCLIIGGGLVRKTRIRMTGWALGQAAFVGWLISSAYKSFSGRIPPEPYYASAGANISNQFQFGFWQGGILFGWPSSHTAVAFAMAVTLMTLFPKHRGWVIVSLIYALFIGLGVSVTVHWFSDFVAGAIIGSVIGVVVGKTFKPLVFKKN